MAECVSPSIIKDTPKRLTKDTRERFSLKMGEWTSSDDDKENEQPTVQRRKKLKLNKKKLSSLINSQLIAGNLLVTTMRMNRQGNTFRKTRPLPQNGHFNDWKRSRNERFLADPFLKRITGHGCLHTITVLYFIAQYYFCLAYYYEYCVLKVLFA